MVDWNKIKADTEAKQKKFGRFSLADVACFALIEVIDNMFSANARAAQLQAERNELARKLEQAQIEILELHSILNLSSEVHRYIDAETPLSQALDGQGDEVEPISESELSNDEMNDEMNDEVES